MSNNLMIQSDSNEAIQPENEVKYPLITKTEIGVEMTFEDDYVINIREPKVRDMMLADTVKGEAAKEIALISSLTQLTNDELMEMTMKKFSAVQKQLQDFLA